MIMLFALAFATSLPPASADWTIIAESERGVMAIDPASIEAKGDLRLVWTRAATMDDEGLALTMLMRDEVDCARRTWAKRLYVPLGDDGVAGESISMDEPRKAVTPGSVGEAIVDRVCG